MSWLSRNRRRWIVSVAIGLAVAAPLIAAYQLASPVHASIGAVPADLTGLPIEFDGAQGVRLRGWWIPADQARGAVLLMHGVRGNRLQMVDRARFLHRAGYAVLLYDSRAHGESGGDAITFGYLESRDARAAVELVHARAPGQPVALIGVSLGGAAAALADPALPVDALILESVYPAVDRAISNRLGVRLGPAGRAFTPLLISMFVPRLGFDANQLRPIESVRRVTKPKMFIYGTEDQRTTLEESRQLFDAAAQPKEKWEVVGASHADLCAYSGNEYEDRVLRFLGDFLR